MTAMCKAMEDIDLPSDTSYEYGKRQQQVKNI